MSTHPHINWHKAGARDWDLSVITGAHADTEPQHHSAQQERELIRAHIPNLTEQQLRDYLNGILDEMEPFFFNNP